MLGKICIKRKAMDMKIKLDHIKDNCKTYLKAKSQNNSWQFGLGNEEKDESN